MATTNFDRWQLLCKDLSSPQSFVDFGFIYLIGAALQRRVWVGPDHYPIFPNTYIVLCADAGVGKGLVIKKVYDLLSFHKKYIVKETKTQQDYGNSVNGTPLRSASDANGHTAKKLDEELLIPMAPNTSSFEQLVYLMAKSYDGVPIPGSSKTYTYSSLAFCLEELSSLFRKNTEDISNFLLCAWDCGDYRKETKTSGIDRVKNMCLALFAGTTPSFMQSTFDDKIVQEGLAARTMYICDDYNRNDDIFMP